MNIKIFAVLTILLLQNMFGATLDVEQNCYDIPTSSTANDSVAGYFSSNPNFHYFGQNIDFANVIRIDNNIKTSIFEFCPDGTCDIVIIDGVLSTESTLDYGMLYLYYFSDYFSNNERLEIHSERFAKKIFRKYDCDLKDAKENAICSMKKILKNFEATIYYGRYDEGKLYIYKKP
jgi:hypothetical protein